jgi:hypothetical protein
MRLCQAYPRYSDTTPTGDSMRRLFTALTSLRPKSCHPHRGYDLHIEHPVTPNALDISYVLVLQRSWAFYIPISHVPRPWLLGSWSWLFPTIAATRDIAQPTSLFHIVRETILSHFVYTSTRVQFSR